MSQLIGSMFNGCNPVVSATNPQKVIHKYGLFESKKTQTVPLGLCPLPKFTQPVNRLPHKFKNHLPLFCGDGNVIAIEHLRAFLNA
jgi:hypothetical protein